MISYPDLVVICGEPEYHDKFKDIVLNPAVIIEVLSEATEKFDRGVKFMRYRNFNDTLTDYILVSQIEPHIEHYIRQQNGDRLLKEYYRSGKKFPDRFDKLHAQTFRNIRTRRVRRLILENINRQKFFLQYFQNRYKLPSYL